MGTYCQTALRSSATLPVRGLSSISYSSKDYNTLNGSDTSSSESEQKYPIPDFNDAKAAFESKSTPELLRAAATFRLCRIPMLVNHAENLLGLSRRVLGNRMTDAILKTTLYGHFCAGEDQKRIEPVLKKLDSAGIGSILGRYFHFKFFNSELSSTASH